MLSSECLESRVLLSECHNHAYSREYLVLERNGPWQTTSSQRSLLLKTLIVPRAASMSAGVLFKILFFDYTDTSKMKVNQFTCKGKYLSDCTLTTLNRAIPSRYTYDLVCGPNVQAPSFSYPVIEFSEGLSCDLLVNKPVSIGDVGAIPQLIDVVPADPARVPSPNVIKMASKIPDRGCFIQPTRCYYSLNGTDGNTDYVLSGICTLVKMLQCPSFCSNGQVLPVLAGLRFSLRK